MSGGNAAADGVGDGAAGLGEAGAAALGLLDGDADALADGVAPGDGVAGPLGDGVGFGTLALVSGVDESTLRNRSSAVAVRALSWSGLASPGTLTTMLRSPWVTTSASATPLPLTRSEMIRLACSSFAPSGAPPPGTVADSVMLVPPCRSRPSFGAAFLSPVRNTSA